MIAAVSIQEYNFIYEIGLIFILASIVGFVASKFKLPSILAYIFTGIIAGQSVLDLVANQSLINGIAEVGVIALLFTLGLEFSFEKFKQVKNVAIITGIAQVIFTIAISTLICILLGFNYTQSFLIGSIIALSSTVIVMKSLTDSAQLDSLHGRIILGILIIQDLSLIPIMIILPNLGASMDIMAMSLVIAILKATLFLILAFLISFKIAPAIMNMIANANKEYLVIIAGAIALGTAMAASFFGLSLAIGAFIAGFVLSVTVQSRQVIAEIVPFRDVFAMVFFVSIGMLMDLRYFVEHFPLVITVVLSIIAIKFIVSFLVVFFAKYPGQTALWSAISLMQIGEFSFVIANVGRSLGIITQDIYSLTVISALITMVITPFAIESIPLLLRRLSRRSLWNKFFKGVVKTDLKDTQLKDHIILSGFGPIARSLAKVLTVLHEEFIVIELNNNTINMLRTNNIPCVYGDSTNIDILEHAGVNNAKIMIVTLPDIVSSELAVINAKRQNPNLFIVVRARYNSHVDKLYNAGANIVVYEEYEISLAIVAIALQYLKYLPTKIEAIVDLVRVNKCEFLEECHREQHQFNTSIALFKDTEIEWIKITDTSPVVGKVLLETDIRQKTGASLMAIIKNNINIVNPPPDTVLNTDDIIVALGNSEQIQKLKDYLSGPDTIQDF